MTTVFRTPPARPEVHGHRGCRGLLPENTLPAFLHAVALGVDVLEMDVVLSADGKVVVSHEAWMNPAICLDPAGHRIEPGQELQHNLYRLPYASIRTYDCGSLQHPMHSMQRPQPAYKPLLAEVVAQVDSLTQSTQRPAIRFSIEVKSSPAGDNLWHPAPEPYAKAILAELHRLDILARTTLLCFDKRVLQQVRSRFPGLPLCLLVEDNIRLDEHLNTLGFVPAVYGPCHELVTAELMAQACSSGMQVVPWTVNNPADMERLLQLQVTGITTDYPDRLIKLLHTLGYPHE